MSGNDIVERKIQTLAWVGSVPREKLNAGKMVMVFDRNGKVVFYPRHLI